MPAAMAATLRKLLTGELLALASATINRLDGRPDKVAGYTSALGASGWLVYC